MFIYLKRVTFGFICFTMTACGGGNSSDKQTDIITAPVVSLPTAEPQLAIPDNRYADRLHVLLVGNSHVRAKQLVREC